MQGSFFHYRDFPVNPCTSLLAIAGYVEITVKNCKSALQSFNCILSSNKQLDYSGNWDTFKDCKNYIEYICSADGFVSSPYFFIPERLFIQQRKLINEHTANFWFIQSSIQNSAYSVMLDYFCMDEIGLDFLIHHLWSNWITTFYFVK